jgi:hypothetical protein
MPMELSPFHPQPLFVPFQPFGVDVYKIKVQRTAEFRQRGAEFLKGLGVAYTFLDQQTVDVVVQIITDGLAHDLAGCLFDKRVQRVFLVAGLKIQNLLLQLFRLGFDKGVYALLVGAIPLGAAFVKVPKFGVERNVQADVLDSAVFREP